MKLKPWAMMPTAWIQEGKLHNFHWRDDGSAGTTALMIYFVLCQLAAHRPLRPSENPEPEPDKPSSASEPKTLTQTVTHAPATSPLPPPQPTSIAVDPGVSQAPPWAREAILMDGAQASTTSMTDWDLILDPAPITALNVQVTPNPAFTQIPVSVSKTTLLMLDKDKDDDVTDGETPDSLIARVTYDELASLLGGMSKDRISAGLQKLMQEKMIWRVDRSSSYGLAGSGPHKRWAKLPGKVLLSPGGTRFQPFTHFKLRSKDELNALKLHFYYAHTRDSALPYSMVSYPMIVKKTGVPERDIPRANSFLISCGMLQRTRGLMKEDPLEHESNKYHLTGYDSLVKPKPA